MIKVTIELLPHGFERNKSTLGIMEIFNKGTGTGVSGHYGFRIFRKGSKTIWKSGDVEGFPRKRLLSWDLLYRCLHSILQERNE